MVRFGGSGSLKIWRSFMTEQIAKSFAKGRRHRIAPMVYDTLLKEQGLKDDADHNDRRS